MIYLKDIETVSSEYCESFERLAIENRGYKSTLTHYILKHYVQPPLLPKKTYLRLSTLFLNEIVILKTF